MITFAITSVIAFSSVFGAWGIIECKKDHALPEKVLESNSPKDQDKKKKEQSPTKGQSHKKEEKKSLTSKTGDSFEVVDPQPEPVKEEAQPTKVDQLMNQLENELEKKKEEELRIRREQLTKLIEEEKRRREELERIEKEKIERKRLEDEAIRTMGRQIFALTIDHNLRSKKSFPSHAPLSFESNLSNHMKELEKLRTTFNGRYQDCIPESVLEFLLYHPRFIINQEKYMVKLRYLTPYQGENKVTGHFLCSSCTRPWKSQSSLKDTPFKCKHCNIQIYPHKQEFDERELQDII